MSKICQITGKSAMVGNNVSHSKRRTKRTFDINLFTKKFYWVEQDAWISLKISANGLRVINKLGLNAAIKRAAEKGYYNKYREIRKWQKKQKEIEYKLFLNAPSTKLVVCPELLVTFQLRTGKIQLKD